MAIYYPPIFINKYLEEKVVKALPNQFDDTLRFFPTAPTDITAITESFPESSDDVFAVYDRMFRMRRSPFPYVKAEQLLYYFYKNAGDISGLLETTQIVYQLLDRGDDSAKDINDWMSKKVTGTVQTIDPITGKTVALKKATFDEVDYLLPYFHNFKLYQLEESRDIITFKSTRSYYANKIIIDYEWH